MLLRNKRAEMDGCAALVIVLLVFIVGIAALGVFLIVAIVTAVVRAFSKEKKDKKADVVEKGDKDNRGAFSLGAGIVSLLIGQIPLVGWFISLAALVYSINALNSINKTEQKHGKGMAISGIVLSGISTLIMAIAVIRLMHIGF